MKKLNSCLMLVAIFGVSMLFWGVNGQAYIDPSVSTYLIQAIAAVVVAVGGAIGIYFRKAKKKVQDKLGIDENANKEVESDELFESQNEVTEDNKAE